MNQQFQQNLTVSPLFNPRIYIESTLRETYEKKSTPNVRSETSTGLRLGFRFNQCNVHATERTPKFKINAHSTV